MEIRQNTAGINPFNMRATGGSRSSTSSAATGSGSTFEQQLTQALSESLGRLGIGASAVNISIRNGIGAQGSSSRQIVISWEGDNAAAAPVQTATASNVKPTAATEGEAQPVQQREKGTPWCPYDGPCDWRDALPIGGGQVTASGAPLIVMNQQPTANQYGYTGPAAFNPYYTNPGNPLRQGYVLGFQNWFRPTTQLGGPNGPMYINQSYYATEEGANEALRLVRQYEPEAELVQGTSGGGPFSTSNQPYYVSLPGNRLLNAGLLLNSYYNHGYGVTSASDQMLEFTLQIA